MNLDRIAALLAKAERTDNHAEAEAYLMKAQALATAASIDLAFARARTHTRQQPASPQSRTRTIGDKGKRANVHLVSLFIVIAHVNDCQVDVASDSTFVISYGMPEDLDAAETLFASLAVQMTTSAQGWLSQGIWRSETYVSTSRSGFGRRQRKPHTAQTARAAFYRAFAQRIHERLSQARDEVRQASQGQEVAGTTGALVLRAKDDQVRAFHQATSAARGGWSGYAGAVRGDNGGSAEAGRRAASSAQLREHQGLKQRSQLER